MKKFTFLLSLLAMVLCNVQSAFADDAKWTDKYIQRKYLQPIITQYFIDNKSEIWLLFLIAHSKR